MTEYEKMKLGYRHVYELEFTYKDKKGNSVFTMNAIQSLANPECIFTKPQNIKRLFNLYKSSCKFDLNKYLCNGTLHFKVIKYAGFLRTQKPNVSYSTQNWIFKR